MISGVTSPLAGNRGPCNRVIWSEFSEGTVFKSWVDERNPRGSKHKPVETEGSISKSCELLTHVPWQPHGVEVGEQIHWLLSFLLPPPDGASRCAEHSRNPDRGQRPSGSWGTEGGNPPTEGLVSSHITWILCLLHGSQKCGLHFGLSLWETESSSYLIHFWLLSILPKQRQ